MRSIRFAQLALALCAGFAQYADASANPAIVSITAAAGATGAERYLPYWQLQGHSYQGELGFGKQGFEVARTPGEYRRLWRKLHTFMGEVHEKPRPHVDFSKEMVVFISGGMRGHGGTRMVITLVEQVPSAIRIRAELNEPGANCMSTASQAVPMSIIRLAKSPKPVQVTQASVFQDCPGPGQSQLLRLGPTWEGSEVR